MSYIQRQISATIRLGTGNFGETGANTVNIPAGLHVSASINKVAAPSFSSAEIQIWGLSDLIMNTVSVLGKPLNYNRDNIISLFAGDAVNGMPLAYTGLIYSAYQNFEDSGNASLNISSSGYTVSQLAPAASTSFAGGADVATMLSGLALQMNLNLQNNGVTAQLTDHYSWGSPMSQIDDICHAAGVQRAIDGNNLIIWPMGGSISGTIPVIGPSTGMVGYPTWADKGIKVKSEYNPNLAVNGYVQIETSLARAAGKWQVYEILHELETENPGGPWFSTFSCQNTFKAS